MYLMKCDFSVGAYGNYFSKQAVMYLGDHNLLHGSLNSGVTEKVERLALPKM